VPENGRFETGDAAAMFGEAAGEARLDAESEIVESLIEAMEARGDARFDAADGQAGQAGARVQEPKADGAVDAIRLGGEVLGYIVLSRGDELCRGRGRGRAQIRDEIGDGEVGFMSNR
jgi:hypothetical protein